MESISWRWSSKHSSMTMHCGSESWSRKIHHDCTRPKPLHQNLSSKNHKKWCWAHVLNVWPIQWDNKSSPIWISCNTSHWIQKQTWQSLSTHTMEDLPTLKCNPQKTLVSNHNLLLKQIMPLSYGKLQNSQTEKLMLIYQILPLKITKTTGVPYT